MIFHLKSNMFQYTMNSAVDYTILFDYSTIKHFLLTVANKKNYINICVCVKFENNCFFI